MIDWSDPESWNVVIGFLAGVYLMFLMTGAATIFLYWLDARLKGRN